MRKKKTRADTESEWMDEQVMMDSDGRRQVDVAVTETWEEV